MKSNFDFLKQEMRFSSFADVAIEAERVFHISLGSAAIGCRTTMEFTVKWMYDVDGGLTMPYEDKLSTLINTPEFRAIVPLDTWRRLDYIRRKTDATMATILALAFWLFLIVGIIITVLLIKNVNAKGLPRILSFFKIKRTRIIDTFLSYHCFQLS